MLHDRLSDAVPLCNAEQHLPISGRSAYSLLCELEEKGWELVELSKESAVPRAHAITHDDIKLAELDATRKLMYTREGNAIIDKWYMAALISLSGYDFREALLTHGY